MVEAKDLKAAADAAAATNPSKAMESVEDYFQHERDAMVQRLELMTPNPALPEGLLDTASTQAVQFIDDYLQHERDELARIRESMMTNLEASPAWEQPQFPPPVLPKSEAQEIYEGLVETISQIQIGLADDEDIHIELVLNTGESLHILRLGFLSSNQLRFDCMDASEKTAIVVTSASNCQLKITCQQREPDAPGRSIGFDGDLASMDEDTL